MSVLAPIGERAAAPSNLSAPTAGGLTWRPMTRDDAPWLLDLQNVILQADSASYRHTLAEVEDALDAPWRKLATDSLVGIDDTGALRAFANVDAPPGSNRTMRVFVSGGVHPSRRDEGIGRQLLAWMTARARQILADSGTDLPARIAGFTEDTAPLAVRRLFERAGYVARRFYSELRRDLSEPIPDVELAGSLRLVPWSAEIDEAIRLAHNDAFRDHWGSEPRTKEMWAHGRSEFAPQWSLAVVDDAPDVAALLEDPNTDSETADALRRGEPLVTGYHMAQRYAEDWAVRGYSFGYTQGLGSRRAYRGRKIAVAALAAGMRAFATDGMQYASLDVDTENPTGAHGLYASLGYVKMAGSRMFSIEL
jgi:mycothiol synthase